MNRITIYSPGFFLAGMFFNLRERITGYSKERKKFKRTTGYELNLKNPRSFTEKIVWKKIYDRNPLMPIVADKYRVRRYVTEILGREEAEKVLVPLLHVTDRPETIPFDDLPHEFIIKPNHASKKHLIIEKDSVIDRRKIIETCNEWLSRPFGYLRHEWAYQKIARKIVIEGLLRDSDGRLPSDYKFFVFHGRCHLIQVIYDRFNQANLSYYTPEWEHLDVKGRLKPGEFKPRPENLESMVRVAESLGAYFDAIRVDLYSVNGRVYFGELTNYHISGRVAWTPVSFDFELGAKWKTEPGYWKRNDSIQNLARKLNNAGKP